MKIDAYSFGSITIDGKSYHEDLIVFPDFIKFNWCREEGHSLSIKDLKEVIDYKPEILVVGTGAYGVLKIPRNTKEAIKKHNIILIDKNTDEACKIFNEYMSKGKRVVGAFHLTC